MDLREQRFGIEIEMTGITREKAAEVTAEYFGTRTHYVGTYYDTYAAIDNQGRQWKFMILSILVDTFSSRILNPMLLPSGKRNIVVF